MSEPPPARRGLLSRRRVLGLLAVATTVPLIAASPEALPKRKAKHEYTSRSLRLRVRVPDLLATNDRQAMAALDSHFTTRLVYDLALFERGGRRPVAVVHVEVDIYGDPWNKDYVVETRVGTGQPSTVRYALRDDAIKAATTLSKLKIAALADIQRGSAHVYFVHVFAQRNPLRAKSSGSGATARGQDRDLQMFSRWVGMFVRSRPKAEKTVEFRTQMFFVPEAD